MRCDRCARDSAVLVPWTRDLNSKRVLMRCCLDCEREVIEQAAERAALVRAIIAVGPGEETEAAEAYGEWLR